jgi:restriction endonuclease Mrr
VSWSKVQFVERASQLFPAVLIPETHRKWFCEPSVEDGGNRDDYSKIGSKIVLIDGSRLAEVMIEFGVAVATEATYSVKRIDNDFFESI